MKELAVILSAGAAAGALVYFGFWWILAVAAVALLWVFAAMCCRGEPLHRDGGDVVWEDETPAAK